MSHGRRAVAIVALATLVTLGGCVGALTATDATGQVQETEGDGPTIHVSASGQVEAEPDEAILQVAVVATAEDATTARDRLAANVSTMREALREAGIEDDQVRTAFFDIDERRDRTPEGDEPSGYQAIQAFEITVTDVDRAGEIVDVAVNNGANRIDGVTFTLSEETRQQLREQALREAVSTARTEADVLADAAGLEIAGVRSISTVRGDVVPYRAELEMADADAGTTLEPGPVTVSATVTVTYEANATATVTTTEEN